MQRSSVRRELRRRRPLSRAQRQRRNDWRGGLLIAVVALALVGLLGGSLWLHHSRPAIDPTTFCPVAGATTITAVLTDTTDPLPPVQAEAIRRKLADVVDSVPTGGALELYAVAPVETQPRVPLAASCNPGHGAEVSVWTSNPKKVEARWKTAFATPLDNALARGLEGEPALSSPILESLQSVAVTAFSGPGKSDKPHRLVLASDLLQHSRSLSLFKRIDPRFLDSPAFAQVRPDLAGVEVEILYLNRATSRPIQGAEHLRFWLDLLAATGAQVTSVDRIPL